MRKHLVLIIVGSAVAAVSVGVAMAVTRHEHHALAAGAPEPPSPAKIAALKAAALEIASSAGDNHPSSMDVVPSTRRAINAADTGAMVNTDQGVYVVSMMGRFRATNVPVKPGSPAPTGTVLTLVYDAASNDLLDLSIGMVKPSLRSLGPVTSVPV